MFPLLYHIHHNAHIEDLPFWLKLAQQQGGPVLELGCGTGRVLVPLIQAGFKVYGVDSDPQMLAFLRKNLANVEGGQATLVEADMANFSLPERFPLAILPCNTFSTLDLVTRQATLANVLTHLQPRGVFAVSVPNPVMLEELPQRSEEEVEESFPHPITGNQVQVLSSWQRTKTQFIVTWSYDHLQPDGRIERISGEARHWLTPAETYVYEIDAAGFEIHGIYGDFEGKEYDPEDDDLIIVCRK